jgi:hypothetical protein
MHGDLFQCSVLFRREYSRGTTPGSRQAMKSHPDNPSGNVVPPGIVEPHLAEAIAASGYPLQGIVTAQLLADFSVLEEWGFVDDKTDEHRSLDIYAYQALSDKTNANLHVGLTLLIECKRSRHPFIFFQA